jgi:competence ComEA-like helix-hairpin-helix protein
MTRQERTALGVVALLLALSVGARWLRPDPTPAEWSVAEAGGGATGLLAGSEAAADRAEQARRPLAEGERIDPNTASAVELDRLPRVGPALAARIVARRETHGPYRTLAELDSVAGVGPALLEQVAPNLTLPPAPAAAPAARPLAGASAAATVRPAPAAAPASGPLDLNAATTAELDALPGIGPALAARIVAWRAEHGRFRAPEELEQVPGIGKKSLARLLPLVRASP